MMLFFFFIFLIFGLIVGSFLNVVIDRIVAKESIVFGRSYCDKCKRKLSWYDLIPVVSFLLLRRKCRSCKEKISVYYPLIELTSAILFSCVFLFLSQTGFKIYDLEFITSILYNLFIISALIVVFFTDLKYGIIPDRIVFPSILISLVYLFTIHYSLFTIHLISAIGAALFFLLLFLVTKGRGMGLGDVKLAFLLGLFLGFPKIVSGLYMAFLTGAVVSIILVLWGKKKFHGSTIAFGPFMVMGALLSFFYGDFFINYFMLRIF